jgi:hypothetical protein
MEVGFTFLHGGGRLVREWFIIMLDMFSDYIKMRLCVSVCVSVICSFCALKLCM